MHTPHLVDWFTLGLIEDLNPPRCVIEWAISPYFAACVSFAVGMGHSPNSY